MKIWLGLVLGGICLISVWALPPKSYEDWRRGDRRVSTDLAPERVAYNRLLTRVRRENWLYQRLQWRDSVLALVRSAEAVGQGWSVVLPDSAPDRLRLGLEAAVSAQLDAEQVRDPLVPVGVVLMDARTGTHPSAPAGHYGSPFDFEVYVGRTPEAPFCFLVRPVDGMNSTLEKVLDRAAWAPEDGSAPPSPLGPCLLHARYGMPGLRVLRWLAGRGYAMAMGGRSGVRDPDRQLWGGRAFPALGRRTLWGEGMPEAEACLAGRVEGCRETLFPDTLSVGRAGRWRVEAVEDTEGLISRIPDYGFYLPFGGREFTLLRDLEEEFGPERFQAFWSSDQEVEAAFRAAFDTGFPEWVRAWGQERFGASIVGARVPFHATLLSLLTIGAFAGAALISGRRRG
jgi:hypothetical protein